MVATLAGVAVIAATIAIASGLLAPPTWRRPLGLKLAGLQGDDAGYLELAAWARENTPKDAVFLVPPDEESFRVHARRAIVVNFKGVRNSAPSCPSGATGCGTCSTSTRPACSACPGPWAARSWRSAPDTTPCRPKPRASPRIRARYVVFGHAIDAPGLRLVHADSTASFFLYDLSPEPTAARP